MTPTTTAACTASWGQQYIDHYAGDDSKCRRCGAVTDSTPTTAAPVPSYGVLLGGFVWPPCCDLIRARVGWRFRTQRVGEPRRMRLWWVPTRGMADAVAKRWVEREGRRGR